jgi:hypothetical protein
MFADRGEKLDARAAVKIIRRFCIGVNTEYGSSVGLVCNKGVVSLASSL